MSRMNKKLMLIGLLAVAALIVSTSEANAFGYRGCYSGCYSYYAPVSYYSACYTPCSTSCYTSPYYMSCGPCNTYTCAVRPGPVRRWAFGPYRCYPNYSSCYNPCSYGYGYGCNSCYTGCNTCYTGCNTGCGSCGTCDSCTSCSSACNPCSYTTTSSSCCQPADTGTNTNTENTYQENEPTVAPPAGEMENGNTTMVTPTTSYPTYEDSGTLTIWVPYNAKVIINGYETKTTGSKRRYVSTGLKPGLTYKYEITAQLARNGKLAEETKTVYLQAGATEGVAFGFNRKPINELAAAQ